MSGEAYISYGRAVISRANLADWQKTTSCDFWPPPDGEFGGQRSFTELCGLPLRLNLDTAFQFPLRTSVGSNLYLSLLEDSYVT